MWTSRASYLLITLVLLTSFIFAYPWLEEKWYENYRYVEKVTDIGFSLNARQNPYLAAQQYLSQLKKSVYYPQININWANLETRPNTDACVFWNGSRLGMGDSQLTGLNDWLEQGGQLITVVTSLFDESTNSSGDVFLDNLGVRQYLTDYDEKLQETKVLWPTPNTVITHIELPLENESLELEVNFDPRFRMEDISGQAIASYGSQYGIHALLYKKNKGQVLVVTDPWLWENQNISRLDHAYFLWHLTKNCSDIWLIVDNEVLNLWGYIWLYGAWFVVSVVILLVAWLWYISFRIGPITVTTAQDRRQLMEHLKAASYFLWRYRIIDKPIELLRKDISRSLTKQRVIPTQAQESSFEYISQLTQIPVKDISWAMQEKPNYRLIDFIKMMSILSAIRKTL